MKRIAAFVVVLSLWALPAKAQESDGWPTHLAVGSYITLQGIDLSVTMFLLGSKQGREVNPVLAPLSHNPVAFGAVKMGTTAATGYLLLRLHRQHPKLAFWLSIAVTGLYTGVVVHNAQLLRKD